MDFDKKIYIDNNFRSMTLPKGFVLGVYNDKDSHKVCFNMPRYFNSIDLSEYAIYVNSTNSFGDDDQYIVKDIEIGEGYIEFIWLVQKLMYIRSGIVTFSICLKKADSESNVVSEFNSTTATAEVLVGLEPHGGVIEDVEKDIIVQILGYRNEARQYAAEAELAKNKSERAQELSEDARDVSIDFSLKARSYAIGDAVDDEGNPVREGQETDNAKYYKEQAQSYAETIGREYKIAQSYARGDALNDSGRAFREGQETDNAKYYSEQSAIEKAGAHTEYLITKSYVDGEAVDDEGNPVREGQDTDNAKFYSDSAKEAEENSDYYSKLAKSYVTGDALDDEGEPIRAGQDTDNAAYYANVASDASVNAESYAVGSIGGEPVAPEHETYHNNSKWYAEKAREYADQAGATVNPFRGATEEDDGSIGLVPNPSAGDQDKVLHGDGTWRRASNNTTWTGTLEAWEALSLEQKAEYKYVNFINDDDIDIMQGATEYEAGVTGTVPTPPPGSNNSALMGDASWRKVPVDIFIGLTAEWLSLSDSEKAKYRVVFLIDYNDPGVPTPLEPVEPTEPTEPEEPENGGEEP